MAIAVMLPTTVILSQQEALLPRLDATAANLANSDTSGFKKLLSPTTEVVKKSSPTEPVSYVSLPNVTRDFSQGSLKQTREEFDIGLSGKGFFMLADNKFSRNGHFTVNNQGQLVNATGQALLDAGGSPVSIPKDGRLINITQDGTISSGGKTIGRIGVADFADSKQLVNDGNGLYTTTAEIIPAPETKVMQGYVEESNVQPVMELMNLIDIQRLFEAGQKILEEEMQRRTDEINVSVTNA